jgi:hypothetical protein
MAADASRPSPQLLEDHSQFFRLLSEPARLQLICHLRQLQRAGLITCACDGNRTLVQALHIA